MYYIYILVLSQIATSHREWTRMRNQNSSPGGGGFLYIDTYTHIHIYIHMNIYIFIYVYIHIYRHIYRASKKRGKKEGMAS